MNAELMHAAACAYINDPSPQNLEAAYEACIPLCEMIARRFSGRGVEYEDLKQVAAMAAIAALRQFDPERGLRFTTYVTPTITGKVRNYVRDNAETLHAPRTVKEQRGKLMRARENWIGTHHREPSVRELTEILHWTEDKVLDTLNAMQAGNVLSLNTPDENGVSLEEKLADPLDALEHSENRTDLEKAMNALNDTEKHLIELRYRQGYSQKATAEVLRLSQMQVSRAEKRILATLKKQLKPA